MPTQLYNNFHLWLGQDDHKTGWPKFIDTKNLTWIENWYWVTLWPKVNKLFYSDEALRGIYVAPLTSIVLDERHVSFWDDWEVFVLWLATDNTPTYTFTTWGKVRGAFLLWAYYYFLHEWTPWNNTLHLAQVSAVKVYDWTFTWINETYQSNWITHIDNPPILVTAQIAYIWWLDVVKNIESDGTPWTNYTWVNRYVTAITKHMTQFTMYTTSNEVYYATETAMVSWWIQSWSNILNFQPRRAIQTASLDYIIAREWQLEVWWGKDMQEISTTRKSERLEDNSSYQTIFNFDPWTEVAWNIMTFARGKLYIAVNDSVPWIMVYGKLIPWVHNSFNKTITTNSDWDTLEKVYAVQYEHTQNRVYFTYKTATKYWIDYIDIDSKETTQSWYGVTEVFSANTAYIKKPNQIRITANNTSWDNYVKLYVRINNGSWGLIKTVNDTTNVIARHEIKAKYKKKNIDIQFKVVLYNDTEWTTPPMVQELLYDYTVLPK